MSEWIKVTYKKKSNKIQNDKQFKPTITRLLVKSDYTLTNDEKEKYGEQLKEILCYCCFPHEVSEIIGRKFYSCHRCYCCVGDDPYYDQEDLCIYITE